MPAHRYTSAHGWMPALTERPAGRAALFAAGTITAATDADVPAIVALMNRSFRGGDVTGWTTQTFYLMGDRTSETLVREDLAGKPDGSFLIWRDRRGDDPAGCVWLEPLGGNKWYLGSLTVDPRQQNSGLGRHLLSSAEQRISARGGARVRISVINVREVLIAWYLRRGYCLTGETEPFPYGEAVFGVPEGVELRLVFMEKSLTGLVVV
jgi:ribosomal protein S18 acetylase RimI-like enzyme